MKHVTVVIGHRGGGQLLGVFSSDKLVEALKDLTKQYHEEGYVSFEKVRVDELQKKHFGLYFK